MDVKELLMGSLTRRQVLKGIGATAVGAAASAPLARAFAAASGPIRIGAIYPLTGGMALLGEESWRGAEVARVLQNKKGGILGRQIEFVKGDAPDANAAVSQANRLISSEKLPILIGTYASPLALAASEVAERNQTIYWEMGGIADPIVQRGFKYLFRITPMGSMYGGKAAEYSKEVLAPKFGIAPNNLKISIVHEDALYGTTVGVGAEQKAKELGLKVLGRDPYSSKATDLSPLILKLKAAQPDVLIATSYIQDLLIFWKQARELGFWPKAVIGTGAGYALTEFAQAMGDDATGVFNVDNTQYLINPNFAPGAKEAADAYQEMFKEPPRSGHSLMNYMGSQVLFDVIARAGGTDPAAIQKAALATDIPDQKTPMGYGVKFAGPGDKNAGQDLRAFPLIFQWQNGKQLTIWPKAAAVAEAIIPWPAAMKHKS
ncbi:MAG TPA: ABC transporter substrate-binding protein [Candidatus Baltobacteraceae bacterium]|nr:ABC transporter substrate-binding protein [Candidatus Baltobacteraceae bacterium]